MKILEHLNDFERTDLLNTHSRHTRGMSKQEQQKHELKNIIKVERNHDKQCFHVHYKHGEWYHYTLSNEWY